ncbi:Uncharacterized protein FKW44_012996 [Caligus rogercresseyi]|uniref:Uncharacterized protein n=1 Tax=Caligus rogercresseyi TaxID=217165 RepID=A0A7T8HKF9_CALRO|nr:Uncharacterized protein FKW44_012996 [Caligus rogercresseyi]
MFSAINPLHAVGGGEAHKALSGPAHICRGIRALFLCLAQIENLAAQFHEAGKTHAFGHYECA